MFHSLVSHNEDLKRLLEKGYAISFDSGHLITRDIPYLDSERRVQIGAIVTKLDQIDKYRVRPHDHQVFFCGSHPCQLDGTPIANLGGGPAQLTLSSSDIVVQRSFSNKPAGGFSNFYDKIESYVTIISGPAEQLHGASPLTFRMVENLVSSSVFSFQDTLTSRAEIGDLAAKLTQDIVAVIGLGGTGAYVLDYMVKAPVKEIRAFDLDKFHVHNAFRSPGRLDERELGTPKAEVYEARYKNFRSGIVIRPKFIDSWCGQDFEGVTFAFVCVDKGSSRSGIFDLLISKKIAFIDAGMGLDRQRGILNGLLRTTYYSAENAAALRAKQLAPMSDNPDDEYRLNIQISELNALNAAMAVIKYKQLRSFYLDENLSNHLLFGISDLHVAGDAL